MRTWILGLGALLPACTISMLLAPAEFVVDGRDAEVGSSDLAEAQRLARFANALAPLLRSELVDVRAEKMRVRVLDSMPNDFVAGITFHREEPRWVALAPERMRNEHTLAHEAVHFWLGEGWDALPPIVEEGLCDMLADALLGRSNVASRARKLVVLHTWNEGGFRLPLRYWIEGSGPRDLLDSITITVSSSDLLLEIPSVDDALAGEAIVPWDAAEASLRHWQVSLGELLARRIGVRALRDLCERARVQRLERVPPQWILAAAGVSPGDKNAWRRAFAVLDGDDVRRHIGAALRQSSSAGGAARL